MYLTKTPSFVKSMFPSKIWQILTPEKKLYLTFDDGPVPEVTPFVLKELEKYSAKATFFCVGANVYKNHAIYKNILNAGHSVGSHTYNHLNGWNTDNLTYLKNVRQGATIIQSSFFRPPYGRLKPIQTQFINRHYKIIMWDVLSGDFDRNITGEHCYQKVIQKASMGSIVVFHDSIKAFPRLKIALPKTLAYFNDLGYTFDPITEDLLRSPLKSNEPRENYSLVN